MKIWELKQQIENLSDEMEVSVMNVSIEEDKHCPVFSINTAEECKGSFLIHFEDSVFIKDEINIMF